MRDLRLALCSETDRVKESDLYRLSIVAHEYAQLVRRAWPESFGGDVDIKVIDRRSRVAAGWRLLLFVDASHESNVLANHTPLGLSLPTVGRVYVGRDSGRNRGKNSLSESCTHEIAEIISNPDLLLWADISDDEETPLENADGSQETVDLEHGGEAWPVANFLHPAWFGLANPPGVHGYDHAGRLTRPFEMEPSGYMVIRKKSTGESRIRMASGLSVALPAAGASRQNSLSRTRHLMGAM